MSYPNDARRYELVDVDGSVIGDISGNAVNGAAVNTSNDGVNINGNPPSTSKVHDTVTISTNASAAAAVIPAVPPAALILPNGEIMNSKNTLQSFDDGALQASPQLQEEQRELERNVATAATSPLLLPNGEVMNCKNTLQSFDEAAERTSPLQQLQRRTAAMELAVASAKNSGIAEPASDLEVQEQPQEQPAPDPTIHAQAVPLPSSLVVPAPPSVHLVEGELFDPGTTASTSSATISILRKYRTTLLWVFLVIVVGAVAGIGGYCGTGNCGTKSTTTSSKSNDEVATSPTLVGTKPPTPNPPSGTSTEVPTVLTVSTNAPFSDEELSVACNFLSLPDLTTCLTTRSIDSETAVIAGNTIPTVIGLLTQLTYLDLQMNQLSGTIPSTLGNLANLIYLDLSKNQLTGTIPSVLCSISGIDIIVDCANITCSCCTDFEGNMCPNIFKEVSVACNFLLQTSLTVCQKRTSFIGATAGNTIPSEIGLLSQLTSLDLSDNQLAGPIPSTLGNLLLLTYLDMSRNQLNGTIPAALGNLVNLTGLDMSRNQLNGTIPAALGNLVNLTGLALSYNQLNGTIPAALGNLVNLNGLDLSDNQLTGTIPATLGNLTNLDDLFLQNNTRLSGTIPSTLCSEVLEDDFLIFQLSIFIDCGNIKCTCCDSITERTVNSYGSEPCPTT